MAAGPLRVWGFDERVRGAQCGLRRLCTLLGWKRLPLKEKKECLPTSLLNSQGLSLGAILHLTLSITVRLTSPPDPLLGGEGSHAPPFPCREGGLGG